MPSRPMFTTPVRSENKPPSPAKTIGTESKSAAEAVPVLVKSLAPVINRIIDMTRISSVALSKSLDALVFMLSQPSQALCFVMSSCNGE